MLTPRFGLGVATLNPFEIAIMGGYQDDDDETAGSELKDIHIFSVRTHKLKRVATENDLKIVPVVYPCVRTQPDIVVTADIYSHEILEYDTIADTVRVVAQMPGEPKAIECE